MMNPIAFNLFGVSVRWYGVIITLGILISGYIAILNAKRVNIKADDITDYMLIAMPFCIIGARLYYVFFQWEYYKGDIFKIINTREGGLAIHGGIIAGILVAYFYCKRRKLKFLEFFDIICVSIPLGQSIGRWGNFTNSEAYGTPTFLYESLWNFMLFIFLMRLFRHKKFDGQIISLYLIIYSVGRFFIEYLRTDALMIMGLRTAQITSIILILSGACLYLFCKKRKRD